MAEIEFSMKTVTERRKQVKRPMRSRYDPILDQFLAGENPLVEIQVPGKTGSYIKTQLTKRVQVRGLEIIVSSVGEYCYLEKGKPEEKPKKDTPKKS